MQATGTNQSGSVAQTESAAAFDLASARNEPLKCQAGGSSTYIRSGHGDMALSAGIALTACGSIVRLAGNFWQRQILKRRLKAGETIGRADMHAGGGP